MESHCSHFLNQRFSLQLVALILTISWHFVTGSAAQIEISGEVGGNVTFHCPVDQHKTLEFFYLQQEKDNKFVNGYHASKNLSDTWENTIVEPTKTSVQMHNLSISHSGSYDCVFRYSDSEGVHHALINLIVTAPYSKPIVSLSPVDENQGFGHKVTCTSHGGYPNIPLTWSKNESLVWKVIDNNSIRDPNTSMFSVSSTAYFNCSNVEQKLSCSVGTVTSDELTVCTPVPPITDTNGTVIIAAVVLALLFILAIIAALWLWKCKKRQRGAAAVAPEICLQEVIALSEEERGEDAP